MWEHIRKYTYKANAGLTMVAFTKLGILGHTPPDFEKHHPFHRLTGVAIGSIGITSYVCSLDCIGCEKIRCALKAGVNLFVWSFFVFTRKMNEAQKKNDCPPKITPIVSIAAGLFATIMTLDIIQSIKDGFPAPNDNDK
eukprot:402076_1